MDKVCAIYSPSPKNQRELAVCAKELDIELRKIGKLLTIRWVASTYRAVAAAHRNYAALHSHFTAASHDNDRDGKTRQTFKGLSSTLRSDEFILNLGLMMYCLSELSIVSEALQNHAFTCISDAE